MITFTLGAPQVIMLSVLLINIATEAAVHGEPRTGNHNVWYALIGSAINVAILTWGGFY